MNIRSFRLRFALLAATLASMVWGYGLMFSTHAPDMFRSVEEDMSFAWFVPLFSLYVLWRERREAVASLGAPSWWGLFAALPFLAVGYLGIRGFQLRFEILGFAGLLVTLAWAFFGRRTAARVLFPAAFLLFCMPLATFLDVVTVHLRLLASALATFILSGCGADVIRRGTMILSPTGAFAIDIAEPCSGLRSLFAMMALTAGYAYFNQPTWFRRGLLFALSVPIAILGNSVRILTIVAVAATCSSEFATGFYHDYSGYVVFFVAISLMLATSGLISAVAGRFASRSAATAVPRPADEADRPGSSSPLVPVLCTVLIVAVMAWQGQVVSPRLTEAPSVRLGELPGFTSETIPVSEAERHTLPKDTLFDKRLYKAPNGAWFSVSMLIGGHSKSSLHRPELCLPSQGFQMSAPHTIEVDGGSWRVLTLGRRDAPPMGFAYTFFNQEGFRTSSHVARIFRDVWDRSVLNRIDRWVMVTVNSCTDDAAVVSRFLHLLGGVVP